MIIDNIQQLEAIGNSVFLYPILKDDRLHRHCNSIIGFVIIDTETKISYTLSVDHPEGVYHHSSLDFLKNKTVYCYDTIAFKYNGYDTSNFIDVKLQYYLYTNQGCNVEVAGLVSHYLRYFSNCHKINKLIPLYKHEEFARDIFMTVWVKDIQPGLGFYQDELINAFYNIEKNGVCILEKAFVDRFGTTFSRDGNLAFTEYNFYTTTGRPSNRFGGINFAALNKEDNTREAFISRHPDGLLLELDFNSYHPRLIAELIGYDFGKDNVYEHLAKCYNNNESPTPFQTQQAKENTFRQLYGGIQKQYLHIPFFTQTDNLSRYLWNCMKQQDYVQSPLSGRRLYAYNHTDLNPNILFNYFIQMYETEANAIILNTIHKQLKEYKTKPVLYTYDSILFDVFPAELDTLLQTIIPKTIDLHKFPIKIKQGKTYRSLQV